MKDIKRIRAIPTRSEHVRCYGISAKLSNPGNLETYAINATSRPIDPLPGTEAEQQQQTATITTLKVINALLTIPGVTSVRVRPFEIHVTLAPVFSWDDIQDSIISLLKENYFASDEQVEVQS